MELDRLKITGELDENTPLCVILEILDCHKISYNPIYLHDRRYINKILDEIVTFPRLSMKLPLSNKSYSIIAGYINPDPEITWSKVRIEEALYFLNTCNELPYGNINIGLQTPEKTNSLNACLLYKLCKLKNILLFRCTTIEQMYKYLKGGFKQREYTLEELIKIEAILDYKKINIPNDKINVENLIKTNNDIKNYKMLPTTCNEAVILAIKLYKLSLLESSNPYIEYMELKTDYLPVDTLFREKYIKNKNRYYTNKNFIPEIPVDIYETEDLIELCRLEGYDITDKSYCYEKLMDLETIPNFHIGYYDNIKNKKTVIDYEDIELVDDIICYGIKSKEMIAITVKELIDIFKNKITINPCSKQKFEHHELNRLKLICNNEELLSSIVDMEMDQLKMDENIKEYINNYFSVNYDTKEIIYQKLQFILNLAMKMRGWLSGEYPIKEALYPPELEPQIHTNVFKDLKKYKEMDHDNLFLKIPLVLYKKGTYDFSKITLHEKLNIVFSGETVDSCIRTSSNWIISTIYLILKNINRKPNFNIEDLRYIS